MEVKGVLGSISFDGEWITVSKKPIGQRGTDYRIRAADVTGTRLKKANRLFHGYVQFVLPGASAGDELKPGFGQGGRPHYDDPHSLSIPRKSNDAAEKLVAAVEQARS